MKNSRSEEEINICQYTEAKQAELKLKELEDIIRSHLKGVQLDRFNDAQQSWRTTMDKDCEFEANFYEGAPVYLAIQSQCLQTHYQTRLQAIQRYQCPEHNYTSGCEPSDYLTNNIKQVGGNTTQDAILDIDHSTTALVANQAPTNTAKTNVAPAPNTKRKKIANTKRFR